MAIAAEFSPIIDFVNPHGFGIPGVQIDGTDFFAIHEGVKSAVEKARAGEGPQFIHIKSNRFFGHFEGDAQTYRAEGEVEELRANKDVIKIFKEKVVAAALFPPEELDAIFEEEEKRIKTISKNAQQAPRPTKNDLLSDVYISY